MLSYVIGASKGLGRAIADKLTACGEVVALSRSSEGPVAVQHKDYLDLASDTVAEQLKSCFDKYGIPDWMVISGGMGAYVRADKLNSDKMDELYKTNQRGPILCTETTMLAMRFAKKEGRILLIGSSVSEHGANALEAYAATKAALNGFIRSACRHASTKNISIMGLNPGWFESPMTQDIHPKLKEAIIDSIPLGRMGTIDEVADIAVSMLNWPVYAAGTIVEVSGGVS